MKRYLIVFYLLMTAFYGNAQQLGNYQPADDIEVLVFGSARQFPWAGGFNNPQFSPVDLNGDGFEDLFVFEKHGRRAYTFLNDGIQNQISFTYAPEYESLFPEMTGIGLLHDYNCDDQPDLFTQQISDIRVYKNIAAPGSTPKFELAYPVLPAQIFNNQSHVYTLAGDIPAIGDINGNGKTDIISFHQLGEFASLFENISDDCDSLELRRVEGCWGLFREDGLSASIALLDSNCIAISGGIEEKPPNQDPKHERGNLRHPGSSLTQFDLSGNGLPDLLLGDVESPYLKALYNTGTSDSAVITQKESRWPQNSVEVNISTKPAAFFADVNNNGLHDAIVSPSEPNASQDFDNVWLYTNTGTTTAPEFTFTRTDFLAREMLDFGTGAHPKFVDFDGDGLDDLIVGNAGYFEGYDFISFVTTRKAQLAYYRNTGTAQNPEFTLETLDYDSLSKHNTSGLFPDFADMDNDGDLDMIAGTISGELYYFENTAGQGNMPQFQLADTFYMGIFAGTYTKPLLYDLNKDGKLDLLVGQYNGTIHYYENKGTASSPQFNTTPTQTTLGGINHRNPGEPGVISPFVAPYPNQNSSDKLFTGTHNGRLIIYDIPQNNPETADYDVIDQITFSAKSISPAAADLNGNGAPEIIYGQLTGGVTLLENNPQAGACCVNNLNCISATAGQCSELGGEFYGAGTTCAADVENCGNTGISNAENPRDPTLKIYPNPATLSITLNINNLNPNPESILTIYDLSGRIMQRGNLNHEKTNTTLHINIQEFTSGVYILEVKNHRTYIHRKFIKR